MIRETDEPQIITGHKRFVNIVAIRAEVEKSTNISIVNERSLEEIEKGILSPEELANFKIRGAKTFFNGIETNSVQVLI